MEQKCIPNIKTYPEQSGVSNFQIGMELNRNDTNFWVGSCQNYDSSWSCKIHQICFLFKGNEKFLSNVRLSNSELKPSTPFVFSAEAVWYCNFHQHEQNELLIYPVYFCGQRKAAIWRGHTHTRFLWEFHIYHFKHIFTHLKELFAYTVAYEEAKRNFLFISFRVNDNVNGKFRFECLVLNTQDKRKVTYKLVLADWLQHEKSK